MSELSNMRKGELFILSEALLWSLFPVITILTFSGVPPLFSAAASTLVSALFFALMITLRGGWSQWKIAPWRDILLTTLFIAIIYYALMFTGFRFTTAGNGSIVALMEVFFSFLIISVLWKREEFLIGHVVGALCMVAGAFIILLPKATGFHWGDLLIIIASASAPIGNVFMQRARNTVTSEFIMFVRSIIGAVFLLALASVFENFPTIGDLQSSILFLMINGFVLLGWSKLLWIEGVHLIPITKAISLASIAPLFTLIFAFFLLGERIQLYQLAAFLPILIGVYLLTRSVRVAEMS